MQRKLAELIVEVEAAQALVFDGYLGPRLRIGAPLIKLRAPRLGITAASDAIEIHGGNGYVEKWPVARILRDAQVNTVWEGPDNILCLDVRRAIEREQADVAVPRPVAAGRRRRAERRPRHGRAGRGGASTTSRRDRRLEDARPRHRRGPPLPAGPVHGRRLRRRAAARAGAAGSRPSSAPTARQLVARLYVRARLADRGPLRGIDAPARRLTRFKDLVDGAFVDDR